jgi:hypothetical protein
MEVSVRDALLGITTVSDLIRAFQDEDHCRNVLEALAWPNGRIFVRAAAIAAPPHWPSGGRGLGRASTRAQMAPVTRSL